MLRKLIAPIFSRPGSGRVFLAVAATVSALILGVSAIRSFSAPRVYVSTVRIKLAPNEDNTGEGNSGPHAVGGYDPRLVQTECEVMRSEVILAQVMNALGTNQTQRKPPLAAQASRAIPDRIAQLRTQIEVRPVRNTNMIDVCVRSEDREEAAQIANALGETYREYQANLLRRVRLPVFNPLKAEVMKGAQTVSRPEGLRTLLGVARDALGEILLGVAAGSAVVWVAFRRKAPMVTDVLPWLFVIVFFVVLGVSMLKSSVNLAVATAAGLLLAFVVGGVADWFVFLRKRYPETPNVFPAVFITVFLLVVGARVLDAVVSPEWYRSTARLRLRLATPDRVGLGTAPGSYAVYDPELIKTQCNVIRSEKTLRAVIEKLDLNRQWGRIYTSDGSSLKTVETIKWLKHRIEVRRIPGTCLIEIRVFSERAEEAARLANALGETYRDHLRDHPVASPQEPAAIQAEILDSAVPAASPMLQYTLKPLISWALAGLCLAFAVGGVVAWNVSGLVKAQSRKLLTP